MSPINRGSLVFAAAATNFKCVCFFRSCEVVTKSEHGSTGIRNGQWERRGNGTTINRCQFGQAVNVGTLKDG